MAPENQEKKEDKLDSVPIYSYRSKSMTEKRTIIWEIEEMENIMSEGIWKAFGLEFELGHPETQNSNVSETEGNFLPPSKWRLQLETVNDEPALSLLLLESTSKVIYYKLSAQVLKNPGTDGPNINAYPQEDYFYEATRWERRDKAKKFAFHPHPNFGSSYSQWMPKCVSDDGTLRVKVDIRICEAIVQTGKV